MQPSKAPATVSRHGTPVTTSFIQEINFPFENDYRHVYQTALVLLGFAALFVCASPI
jgi:hypothetical protein